MTVGDEFLKKSKTTESRNTPSLKAGADKTKSRPARKRTDHATVKDRKFARIAIEQARKSVSENDGRPHPMVGVVLVKNGRVLAACHRGEIHGNHAEYLALEGTLAEANLVGATIYTTLEPCTSRNHPKIPCVERLIERKVGRVVIGMLDPNPKITGRGQRRLRKANIVTDLFPHDLMSEVEELNRDFSRAFDPPPGIPDSVRPMLTFRSASDFSHKLPSLPRYSDQAAFGSDHEHGTHLEGHVHELISQPRLALSDLEKSYDIALEVLGDVLDLSRASSSGHSRRVTAYTIVIARTIGFKKQQIVGMARGAFLHGVARLGVPDSILNKYKPENAEEIAILNEYCVRAYRILKRTPFLQDAAEIVYAQYEYYDGTGYPRGLKGEEIPIGARIFQVANVLEREFELLIAQGQSDEYSSTEKACEMISELSGKHLDPEIVSKCLAMPTRVWVDLRREVGLYEGS